MKSLLFLLFFPVALFAGEDIPVKKKAVPQPVLEMFLKKFPYVKKSKWEKEGELYEAEFKLDKRETEVLFDKEGNWKEIATEYKLTEVPQKLMLVWLQSFYIDWITTEIKKIEFPEEPTTYNFTVTKDDMEREIIYDEKGTLLKEIILKQ
jgi:hypothetical protein